MRKHTMRTGVVGTVLILAVAGNAAVFALPVKQPIYSPEPVTRVDTPSPSTGNTDGDGSSSPASPPDSNVPGNSAGPITAALPQQMCQDRQAAITAIMKRIDTRTQNQITLFDTIASRVESFYTAQNKPVSNYDQLTSAITAAKAQAQTDLNTLQADSAIDCETDPKGMVAAFQTEVKSTTADLQNYRTAVRGLVTAVASASGVTISGPPAASSQEGQQ